MLTDIQGLQSQAAGGDSTSAPIPIASGILVIDLSGRSRTRVIVKRCIDSAATYDRIVLTPNREDRGVSIEIEGRPAGIVALTTRRETPEALTVKMERVKGIEPSS